MNTFLPHKLTSSMEMLQFYSSSSAGREMIEWREATGATLSAP
jgi:hypothetical protein